jgi:hypothetical protein
VFDTIFGLPVHPLVIHATVVILPAAALSVAVAAVWPRFRRWAGLFPLLLSIVALVLVPISTSSGGALENHVGHNALIEKHAHLAGELWIPVVVLLVAAAGLAWLQAKEQAAAPAGSPLGGLGTRAETRLALVVDRVGPAGRPGAALLAVIMLVAALGVVGTLVQVARVGHSGAKAAWSDVVTTSPPSGS